MLFLKASRDFEASLVKKFVSEKICPYSGVAEFKIPQLVPARPPKFLSLVSCDENQKKL